MPEEEGTTIVNNTYNNTIDATQNAGNHGNMILFAFTALQIVVLILNALLKLSLPIEQLWFPFIAFIVVFCVGLYSQAYMK